MESPSQQAFTALYSFDSGMKKMDEEFPELARRSTIITFLYEEYYSLLDPRLCFTIDRLASFTGVSRVVGLEAPGISF